MLIEIPEWLVLLVEIIGIAIIVVLAIIGAFVMWAFKDGFWR